MEAVENLTMEELHLAHLKYLSISRKNRRDNVWSKERKKAYYKKQYAQKKARKEMMKDDKWKTTDSTMV